jgi:hypothetical protein
MGLTIPVHALDKHRGTNRTNGRGKEGNLSGIRIEYLLSLLQILSRSLGHMLESFKIGAQTIARIG